MIKILFGFIFFFFAFLFLGPKISSEAQACTLSIPPNVGFTAQQPFDVHIINAASNTFYIADVHLHSAGSPYKGSSPIGNTGSSTFVKLTVPGHVISQPGFYDVYGKNVSGVVCNASPQTIEVTGQGAPIAGQCGSFVECITGVYTPGLSGYSSPGLFGQILTRILPSIMILFGFLTVIMIVISAIQFITSSGNPEGAAAARGRLTYAIVGFILIVFAYAILQIVNALFLGPTAITQ